MFKSRKNKNSKKMKKIMSVAIVALMTAGLLAGCGNNSSTDNAGKTETSFDNSKSISAISREDGSGTRGAFIELFGIEEKVNGKKVDHTTQNATIANSTDVVMTDVANDPYSIGYVSLGSLNDTVKAVQIDGVDATAENVKNGSYKICRPFNIATKGEVKGLAKDFIDFILSKEGQDVILKGGYIKVNDNAQPYGGNKPSGKIVVAGSSSVTPIMEKLKEAYITINPNADVEIQQSDSTTGMNNAIQGICDIGMASRELSDTEKQTLTPTVIATDGIAVVVNKSNPASNLSKDVVKNIFVGNVTTWAEAAK